MLMKKRTCSKIKFGDAIFVERDRRMLNIEKSKNIQTFQLERTSEKPCKDHDFGLMVKQSYRFYRICGLKLINAVRSLRQEAKLSGDSFDIGEKFEKVSVAGNEVELIVPGYYAVEVRFGSGYSSLNVAQLAIQVVGGSQPSTETVAKSELTVATKPTASKVSVNGKDVSFEAYNIEGNNYFKLRDLAKALTGSNKQFEV